MLVPNKRIFNTEDALKSTFNGIFGRWQLIGYILTTFGYAVINGWIANLLKYNLLSPKNIDCNYTAYTPLAQNHTKLTILQRLTGKDTNDSDINDGNFTNEFGYTIITKYNLFCDLEKFANLPVYANIVGLIAGSLLLGILADKGGRKIILLGCIWCTFIISFFQIVGKDYVSYVFFQFFLSLIIAGVSVTFMPAIVETYPIGHRSFYGVSFHVILCIFNTVLPLLAKATHNWLILQVIVTLPLLLTIPLQWINNESIFWLLSYKEYHNTIRVLSKLAKHNDISFEAKFENADEFLHAKHSKACQIDLLPLLRLKDMKILCKKYPTIDMTEIQKKKLNGSKLRRFLSSFKGNHYRSTNTIYRPFDFIYSPTLLVYVIILCGLWLTNGLTGSIESIRFIANADLFFNDTLISLAYIGSSLLAVFLSVVLNRISRRWMIFFAYFVIEMCLIGSLIPKELYKNVGVAFAVFYLLCKSASYFALIFLMLITVELFPTSLRCTGMGLCFIFKIIGNLLVSAEMLNYNSELFRIFYSLAVLIFGFLTLLLPDTRNFPLPRSILQIEAMKTAIGKRLRSRKVELAWQKRRLQFSRFSVQNANNNQGMSNNSDSKIEDDRGDNDLELNFNDALEKLNVLAQANDIENYDTVASAHDIEQDAHIYYKGSKLGDLSVLSDIPSHNTTFVDQNFQLANFLSSSRAASRRNSISRQLPTNFKLNFNYNI